MNSSLCCLIVYLAKNVMMAPVSLQTSPESPNTMERDFCKETASPTVFCSFSVVPVTSLVMSLLQACVIFNCRTKPIDWEFRNAAIDKREFLPPSCFQPLFPFLPLCWQQLSIFEGRSLPLRPWAYTGPETAGADDMALRSFVTGMFPSRSFWLFFPMLENNLTVASKIIYSRGCCISVCSDTTP